MFNYCKLNKLSHNHLVCGRIALKFGTLSKPTLRSLHYKDLTIYLYKGHIHFVKVGITLPTLKGDL
jgi:hypothetical protein